MIKNVYQNNKLHQLYTSKDNINVSQSYHNYTIKFLHHKLATTPPPITFQVPSTEAKMFDGFIKPWIVDSYPKQLPLPIQQSSAIHRVVLGNSAHVQPKKYMAIVYRII